MMRACRLCGTPWRFEPGFPAGAAWRFKCPDGERCAQHATVRDLAGLDLSDLYAPTPGDAVALRGGVLAEAEAWGLLAFDEAKFEAAERDAQRIAMREPARAARIRDLVGRMRAKTVAYVEREMGR